jgi:hypothetical protein
MPWAKRRGAVNQSADPSEDRINVRREQVIRNDFLSRKQIVVVVDYGAQTIRGKHFPHVRVLSIIVPFIFGLEALPVLACRFQS